MFDKEKSRFKPFDRKVWLASPTMHGTELKYVVEAYETNWMSTVGENINEVERIAAEHAGMQYAVALSSCTAALHLCVRDAGERLYGRKAINRGVLEGKRVFCSDMTFIATMNAVLYEGGVPVFIDTDYATWNMDPAALEKAFELYPDVRLVVYAELYGFSGNVRKIREICEAHNALLIEDAAEAMGTTWEGRPCGSFGDYSAVSFNGNKIITGSSGGCVLTNDRETADRLRKWSTQARENAPWYQHEEIGYNYRMSNVVAGVIRGQYEYLQDHIDQKRRVYERYRDGLKDLPVSINPFDAEKSVPNYWLSAILIAPEAMCTQIREKNEGRYIAEHGKSCPTEILEAIASVNAEGRPIWKPMHLQPVYREHAFIGPAGSLRTPGSGAADVGADIFERGCCLPSDNKITPEQQDRIIDVVHACFE